MALIVLLAIANRLISRNTEWLIIRQRLLLRCPVVGALIRGQKLTQIFTILALTQSVGISFLQGLRVSEKPSVAHTGHNG